MSFAKYEWPEITTLKRSSLTRATGNKFTAIRLMEIARSEQPFVTNIFHDANDNEWWGIEKQFWLKYKREFQQIGFLPERAWNKTKDIHQMMEKF